MVTPVLMSGALNKKRLDRALVEIGRIAAEAPTNGDLVLLVDSSEGDAAAALHFLRSLRGDDPTSSVAARARVKIYNAHGVAALLAFTLGCEREMSATSEVIFDVGERKVQIGKAGECGLDLRLYTDFVEEWREYYSTLTRLMQRLGLFDDLYETFVAWEFKLHLSGKECLRRGLVRRLF